MSLQNINNNHSQSVAAMPLKDLTSDNENNFAMQREEFRRTIPNNSANQNAMNNKKWYGNSTNRFSSRIVESHKNRAVGTSSLNWLGNAITMTKPQDYNYVDRSIIRVRRTGGAVPSKHVKMY